MTGSQTAKDLGLHLQQQIGEVIARHTQMARLVLNPSEVVLLLVEAAVSTTLTAAASVAGNVDEALAGEMFDKTLQGIAACAAADRERSLTKVREARAGRDIAA